MKIEAVELGNFKQKAIKLTQNQTFSRKLKEIPEQDLNYFLTLHGRCAKEPRKVYNELDDFIKRHHTIPEVLSLLSYNYIIRRKIKRADEIMEHNYKHNCENLLVKVNYAERCLRKGEIEEFEEIFEGKYDLRDLYPETSEFHFDEYRAFHVVLGHYFFEKEEEELAEGHLLLASNIQPKHPSVIFLAKKLYKKNKRKKTAKV